MADARSDVAERYAAAAFELALESGALDVAERDFVALSAAIDASAPLRQMLASPIISNIDKGKALEAMMERLSAGTLARHFVGLIARNGRAAALASTLATFSRLLAQHKGEVTATAISARPLTDEQQRALRAQIESTVGKTVKLETAVDAGLLGGLVVKIGSRMVDSSLRTKLNRLQQSLKEASF